MQQVLVNALQTIAKTAPGEKKYSPASQKRTIMNQCLCWPGIFLDGKMMLKNYFSRHGPLTTPAARSGPAGFCTTRQSVVIIE